MSDLGFIDGHKTASILSEGAIFSVAGHRRTYSLSAMIASWVLRNLSMDYSKGEEEWVVVGEVVAGQKTFNM